ncbi:MAG: hypothetical protein HZB33_00310 [Nitrospirae bacterium]|nr:hypothetical protein [Nitrospirota bacterium]
MIDIHCHILPGLDDGPAESDISVAMARMAMTDGITRIVATPHYRHGISPSVADIAGAVEIFRHRLKEHHIAVSVIPGADIHLTFELLRELDAQTLPSINNGSYFLLELPDMLPPNIDAIIFKARARGYVPVITHPERNYSLLMSAEKLRSLRDAGAMFQITAMSISGGFGAHIQGYAHMMLRKGYVDFVATDAHNTDVRPPILSEALRQVRALLGDAAANSIFFKNPEAVLENVEIA